MSQPEKKAAVEEPEHSEAVAANSQIVAQCWLQVMECLTVESLVKLYVADASQRTEVPRTRSALRSRARLLLNTELVVAGERRRLADLDAGELEPIHCTQMLTTATVGAHTINARLGLLRSAFQWAITVGLWDGANPCAGLKWRKAGRSERALSDRLFRFLIHGLRVTEVLDLSDLEWVDFSWICAAVGLRPGDVRAIETADVDLDRRWLTCRQKGSRLLEIPYPASLHPVMMRRVEAARGRRYLFAAFLKGKPGRRSSSRPVHEKRTQQAWRDEILPVLTDLAGVRDRAGLSVDELAAKLKVPRARVEEMEGISQAFDGTDHRGRRVTLAYFRATNVTTKIRRGASAKAAGASVGHERERTTETYYVGSLGEALEETAKLMDAYFQFDDDGQESESDEPVERLVGRNIRRIRESQGLSQAELGERLGETGKPVTERTIRIWETEGLADLRLVSRIATALEVGRARVLEGVA